MTYLKSLSDDVRILLLVAAFWMPVILMCGVYAFRDARRCGRNPVKWAFISAFAPCLMGLIAYLITRDPNSSLVCPECDTPVTSFDHICPNCGARLSLCCETCGSRVECHWKSCPNCSSPVNAEYEVAPPIQHTSRMLRQILTAVILIPALLMATVTGIMKLTGTNGNFLTRYNTDATLIQELPDAAYFGADEWYTITHINADGSAVSLQKYFGNYRITRTAADGTAEQEEWEIAVGGTSKSRWRGYQDIDGTLNHEMYILPHGLRDVTVGAYFYNEADQLFLYQVREGYDSRTVPHYCATLDYDEAGRLIRLQWENEKEDQWHSILTLTPEEANLRYETYTYDSNGNISRAEQYNHLDELQLYTDYLFSDDGTIRVANTFKPDGELVSTSVSRFDSSGELLKQEFYDASGSMTHSVEFGNDMVAFLLLDSTTIMLMMLWTVTMIITALMLLPEKKKAK